LNQCSFIGNLGSDPEQRFTQSGKGVVNVSIAVTEKWGKGEERQEKTEWIPLVVWGPLTDVFSQYLHKGDKVFVQGRWQTRSWEKDGNKVYKTECNVTHMVMLGSKRSDSAGSSGGERQRQPGEEPGPAQHSAGHDDEDLPF